MASSKKTLNPLTDTPTNKTEITKPFMMAYLKSGLADSAKLIEFKAFAKDPANQKEYLNRLTGEPYMDINIPVVREKFCQLFYPNLLAKKKTITWLEELDNL